MKIGGFNKFTLSDYPGEVAAIVFTQGCNFRCPFCHNGNLLSPISDNLLKEEDVISFCKKNNTKLTGLVITGGEPTLQTDLNEFICKIKSLQLKIKLDTNGSHPEVVSSLLEDKLIDYVAMDVKAPWSKYDTLTGVKIPTEKLKESISIIVKSGVQHEFRTTWVKQLLTDDDMTKIRRIVPNNSTYKVQNFICQNALDERLRRPTK